MASLTHFQGRCPNPPLPRYRCFIPQQLVHTIYRNIPLSPSMFLLPRHLLVAGGGTNLIVVVPKQHQFFKWANPGLFFILFRFFQTNNTIIITSQCEKQSCPSSIGHQDLNPWPSEHNHQTRAQLIQRFYHCNTNVYKNCTWISERRSRISLTDPLHMDPFSSSVPVRSSYSGSSSSKSGRCIG